MKKVFSFVAIAAMSLAVTSCGGAEEVEADTTQGEAIEAVEDAVEMVEETIEDAVEATEEVLEGEEAVEETVEEEKAAE